MEENLKCKICGSVFLISMATGLIVANVYICEPCRKKIEENPDFHGNMHVIIPSEGFLVSGITSTASASIPSHFIDNIIIRIPKK